MNLCGPYLTVNERCWKQLDTEAPILKEGTNNLHLGTLSCPSYQNKQSLRIRTRENISKALFWKKPRNFSWITFGTWTQNYLKRRFFSRTALHQLLVGLPRLGPHFCFAATGIHLQWVRSTIMRLSGTNCWPSCVKLFFLSASTAKDLSSCCCASCSPFGSFPHLN